MKKKKSLKNNVKKDFEDQEKRRAKRAERRAFNLQIERELEDLRISQLKEGYDKEVILINTQWTSLYNGTTESRIWITNQTDPAIGAIHKLMINNTNYLLMIADPTYVASYTGIVI